MLRVADVATSLKQQGNALLKAGDAEGAVRAYGRAVHAIECARPPCGGWASDPLADLAAVLHSNMAQAYLKMKRFRGAAACASRALYYNPRCLKSMFRLGRASELMGNTPAALAAYKRALLVAPGDQEVASKLQQLSDTTGPQLAPSLVSLCTSHITIPQRLDQLQWMLRSWAAQTHPTNMYVSLSFGETWSTQEQTATMTQLHEQFPSLSIQARSTPLTQGQHYRALVEQLASSEVSGDMWVMFTDDDDAWHMDRAAAYFMALERLQMQGRLSSTLAVYCCMTIERQAGHTSCVLPWTADEQEGVWVQFLDPDLTLEYWAYAVRLSSALQFLVNCCPAALSHRYWDGCFSKFMGKGHDYHLEPVLPPQGCWMYLYTPGGAGSVTGADMQQGREAIRHSFEGKALGTAKNILELLCTQSYELSKSEVDRKFELECLDCVHRSGNYVQPEHMVLIRRSRELAWDLLQQPGNIYQQLRDTPLAQLPGGEDRA